MMILHISAHYGGGIGSVVRSWVKNDQCNSHTLTYLSHDPINQKPGYTAFDPAMVPDYDIVVCHVWNHPALFQFLLTTKLPPCRLIGWSHMSGIHPPYVLFPELIDYFDDFYYTSPVSNASGIVCETIWSVHDSTAFSGIKKCTDTRFTIGYVGTLDYCKMHRDFIAICNRIALKIPSSRFIVVGDGTDASQMRQEAQRRGLADRMVFTGPVSDVRPFLSQMDVFLYPLQQKHFGTCEQVLGEAMAAGIPCITLDNPAESCIISPGENGIMCCSTDEMVCTITEIHSGNFIFNCEKIKSSAKKIYSIEKKLNSWKNAFEKNIQSEKKIRTWTGRTDHPFLASLGPYAAPFCKNDTAAILKLINSNPQWLSEKKGSVFHYADYFPLDKKLQQWRLLCENVRSVNQ